MIDPSVVIICSDSWIFCLIICPSLSLFHSSTAPFGRPSAFSIVSSFSHSVSRYFSFILSFRLTMPVVSLPAAVQNTIPEGVLSKCWCHERSEQSRSSQGYMVWCGCHEILIPLCYPQEVFCPDKKLSTRTQFSIRMMRETVNDNHET